MEGEKESTYKVLVGLFDYKFYTHFFHNSFTVKGGPRSGISFPIPEPVRPDVEIVDVRIYGNWHTYIDIYVYVTSTLTKSVYVYICIYRG